MKRAVVLAAIVAVLSILLAYAFGQDAAAKTSVTGEVVDLQCYMDHGAHGPGHRDCGIACAKAGNPVGLVDAKGNVYLCLASDKHEPKLGTLIDKMSTTVTVAGKVTKKGGITSIVVDSVQ